MCVERYFGEGSYSDSISVDVHDPHIFLFWAVTAREMLADVGGVVSTPSVAPYSDFFEFSSMIVKVVVLVTALLTLLCWALRTGLLMYGTE